MSHPTSFTVCVCVKPWSASLTTNCTGAWTERIIASQQSGLKGRRSDKTFSQGIEDGFQAIK